MGLITFNIMNEYKNRSTEGRMEWIGFMSSELLSFGDTFVCYGCSLPGVITGSITLSFEDLHIHPYCLLFSTLLSPALGFSNVYPEANPEVSTCSRLIFSLMFPIICAALIRSRFANTYPAANLLVSACSRLLLSLLWSCLLAPTVDFSNISTAANPENSGFSRLLKQKKLWYRDQRRAYNYLWIDFFLLVDHLHYSNRYNFSPPTGCRGLAKRIH